MKLIYTSNPFHDKQILTYEIEFPPYGKKVGFNLLENQDFTIPYITDKIPNSPSGHQPPTQTKQNAWIIAINGVEIITYQGVLDELNLHQTSHRKSRFKIGLCRKKS